MPAILVFGKKVGFDVVENRIFVEVVADDAGNVRIEGLVVGKAGAEGIGHGDVSGAISIEQTSTTQDGITAKDEGVTEVVVDATVDDVDALEAVGSAHVDDVVVGYEVATLNKIDAHLTGEIGVFEICGVEYAGCEQDDVRLGAAFGRERA